MVVEDEELEAAGALDALEGKEVPEAGREVDEELDVEGEGEEAEEG